MPGLTIFANPGRRRFRKNPRVAATLTNRVEEIRYKHREDGRWYKHKFEPGASVELLSDGTAKIVRKDGKPVWMDDRPLDSGGDDVHFFINPGKARRRSKSRTSSKRRKKHRATTRTVSRQSPRKRSTDMARKSRRRVTRRRRHAVARRHHRNPARKRRRPVAVTHYAANPRRRRRRHAVAHHTRRRVSRRRYRHNPSFGVNFLMESVKDGAGVVVGQVATRKIGGLVRQYVPGMSATTGAMSVLPTLVSATATAFVARKFAPRFSRVIAAGAFAEAINGALALTPAASYLSAYPGSVPGLRAWPATKALPAAPVAGVRAWPARARSMAREVG